MSKPLTPSDTDNTEVPTTDHDHPDLPYPPEVGFSGYHVTIEYNGHYAKTADPIRRACGPVNTEWATAGEQAALVDETYENERTLVLTRIGTVYSVTGDGPNQRTLIGSCGDVVAVREVSE